MAASEFSASVIMIDKNEIITNHCYTELVYGRINKKLRTDFSKQEIEELIKQVLKEADVKDYVKKGKNFYVRNSKHNIRITVNSNTFRIITVDKMWKSTKQFRCNQN